MDIPAWRNHSCQVPAFIRGRSENDCLMEMEGGVNNLSFLSNPTKIASFLPAKFFPGQNSLGNTPVQHGWRRTPILLLAAPWLQVEVSQFPTESNRF
jgi:hypothetical protein